MRIFNVVEKEVFMCCYSERLIKMCIKTEVDEKVNEQQERIEELVQENANLKSELTEYWRKEDLEEADADLVVHMRREMVWYV